MYHPDFVDWIWYLSPVFCIRFAGDGGVLFLGDKWYTGSGLLIPLFGGFWAAQRGWVRSKLYFVYDLWGMGSVWRTQKGVVGWILGPRKGGMGIPSQDVDLLFFAGSYSVEILVRHLKN